MSTFCCMKNYPANFMWHALQNGFRSVTHASQTILQVYNSSIFELSMKMFWKISKLKKNNNKNQEKLQPEILKIMLFNYLVQTTISMFIDFWKKKENNYNIPDRQIWEFQWFNLRFIFLHFYINLLCIYLNKL